MTRFLPTDPSLPFLQINNRQLIINGQVGRIYVLEVSGDLKEWEELMRFETDSERMVFEDPNREFTPSQFFRVRVE